MTQAETVPPPKKRITRIHIGDFFASQEANIIHTILGSCVSACLFDPVSRIGGMNHILLPGKAQMGSLNNATRYGINAMELLINKIMGLGGDRRRLVAKVFGGANVLPAISQENAVGGKNAVFIVDFLNNEGIRILKKDLGGLDTRVIYFHTDTGEVLLKRISTIAYKDIIAEEQRKLRRLQREAQKTGDVTLF